MPWVIDGVSVANTGCFSASFVLSLSPAEHLRAVEICLMLSIHPPVLILHSGETGWQAARLIMIDSEIRELILK